MGFIKSNWGIIFSGCGLTIFAVTWGLFKFLRDHKFIKKVEYNELLKTRDNNLWKAKYNDLLKSKDVNICPDLKAGLEFNQEFGIYIDKKTNEKFCPICLDNKKIKTHLQEEMTKSGIIYTCGSCNKTFKDKEYKNREHQATLKQIENMYK